MRPAQPNRPIQLSRLALGCALFSASLLASLLAGCQQLPQRPGQGVTVLEVGALEQLNPNDVLVAPLEYAEEGLVAPDQSLRQAFVRALVRRHYAPLALEYVDERVTEASFPMTAAPADAIFRILVRGWDESLWESRSALTVDLEVSMMDPKDPLGQPLWTGRIDRRFDIARREVESSSNATLFKQALDQVASQLLSAMPARRTEPGFQ